MKNKHVYRADLDGLRAMAILLVMIFHAFPGGITGGYVGVDVFFVISGYLISGIVFRQMALGTFSYRDFYARRIRRIFPALALVLAFCLWAGWQWMVKSEFRSLCLHVAAAAGFIGNIVAYREAGYFDVAADLKPLHHLWSLGVEEQFYLLWPPFLLLGYRWRVHLLWWIGGLALASLVASAILVFVYPTMTFYLPMTRLWELALGGILAWPPVEQGWLARGSPRMREVSAGVGLLMIVAAAALFKKHTLFPGAAAMLPTFGTALVILGGEATLCARWILCRPLMVGVGLISYPLYLWHWPLLSFARLTSEHRPAPWIMVTLLMLSFGLAIGTYFWIEKPLRFGAGLRLKTLALSLTVMALGMFGLGNFARGWVVPEVDSRFAGAGLRDFDFGLASDRAVVNEAWRISKCFLEGEDRGTDPTAFAAECTSPRRPEVAIFGDSHAAALSPGLGELVARLGYGFSQYTIGGCQPYFGNTESLQRHCDRGWDHVRAIWRRSPPDVLFLAGNFFIRKPPLEKFKSSLAELRRLGIRQVVVVGQVPSWPRSVPNLLQRRIIRLKALPPLYDAAPDLAAMFSWDAELRATVELAGAKYVSVLDGFCRGVDGGCPWYTDDGVGLEVLYFDLGHITPNYSRKIAERLFAPLLRQL